MTQRNIKGYLGINIFNQVGPWIITAMDMHVIARDSPSGQLTLLVTDASPTLDTCFEPDPTIKCS